MYEHKLVDWNPSVENIRYSSDHLLEFVDSFFDMTALVSNPQGMYTPHDKEWIKGRLMARLRSSSA